MSTHADQSKRYFLFTYLSTTTGKTSKGGNEETRANVDAVPSFALVMEQYDISLAEMNWTVAVPALGLSLGPLIWSSLADIYGRRIVFIVGTTMAFASTIGAAKAPTYSGYMAARFFQGLGAAPASTVGLAIINDMFYEYERGQKVGLWVLAIDQGLLFGPLIGGFMNMVDQYWVQWLNATMFGVVLVAEILFLPETLYPRNQMLVKMPYAESMSVVVVVDVEKTDLRPSVAQDVAFKRTLQLPFLNVAPVPGMQHPKVWDALVRFLQTWKYAAVSGTICIYSFGWYWWILSIITYIPTAYVQYKPEIQGLLFIGLILGTCFAEAFCSGSLSDWLVKRMTKKNDGVKVAEMRLWLAYPASLMTAIGLVLWGISIDKGYHWIVGQVAFFLSKFLALSARRAMLTRWRSCGRDPDGQHGHGGIRRRLLPAAVDERHHLLRRGAQPQRFHQPLLHRAVGGSEWLHVDVCGAGHHHLLPLRARAGADALLWALDQGQDRASQLGQSGVWNHHVEI